MIDEHVAEPLYKFQQYIAYSEDYLEEFDREKQSLALSVHTNFTSATWPSGFVCQLSFVIDDAVINSFL